MKLHRHIMTANLDDLERVLVTTKACTNDETTSLKLLLSPHKVATGASYYVDVTLSSVLK